MLNINKYDSVSIITEYEDGKTTYRKGMICGIYFNPILAIRTANSTYNKRTSGAIIIKSSKINPTIYYNFKYTSINICRLVLIEKFYKDNYAIEIS